MLSFNNILWIVKFKFVSSPAALTTTLSPDIAAVSVINGTPPELLFPYEVMYASDPSCTTNASTTSTSVLLSLSTLIKYFAPLNVACAKVSIASEAESTSVLLVVTVLPRVASAVLDDIATL